MTDFEKYASPDRRISSMTLNRYGQFVDSYINPAIIEERKNECCNNGRIFTSHDG